MTLVRIGDFFYKWRGKVLPLLMLAMIFVPPAQGPVFGIDENVLDVLGVLTMLVGEAWRIGVVGLKYIRRGGLRKRVYADDLVTGGIFSVCRNPLYVGNILIATGALLVHGQPVLMVPGIAAIVFIYIAIVATEENFLRNKFGAGYDAYCADVDRWLPDLSRLPAAFAGSTFKLRRVVIKEYPTAGAVVLGIVALQANEAYRTAGTVPPAYWTALGAVMLLILAARIVKKTGRLRE